MQTGKLTINVRTAREALPINQALVRVKSSTGPVLYEIKLTEKESGMTHALELPTPDIEISGIPNVAQSPYATYHVEVFAPNFRDSFVNGVQVFPQRDSVLNVEMLALPLSLPSGTGPTYVEILPPALRLSPEEPESGLPEAVPRPNIFEQPFVPEYITVHLGRPSNSSAQNVTVRFADYIKNVCCSEIYPTWPEEALKANIYAQTSLALNRIFTEWYRSRGYDYDITNSTAYDQYFVPGRNIYDNINQLVNDIFNIYLRRPGRVEPFYAEYCNGTTVSCPGMSQWGSYEMASNGAMAQEILNNYYGELELVECNDIRGTEESYPGYPLREGSSGDIVRKLQLQLLRIAINYPNIPLITPDGVFAPNTTQAVKKFQQLFNLTPDGVVGKGTWYQISRIYVGIKRLAELTSEGELPDYGIKEYPGTPLKRGSQGIDVIEIQYYLSVIAQYNENILPVAIDGRYGESTEDAVRSFQREYVIPVDGTVGMVTWNKIIDIYGGIMENVDVPGTGLGARFYPGSPVSYGDAGENVRYIQRILNEISETYPQIPKLEADGEFGTSTQNAVIKFQQLFGLTADGVVGKNTWDELNRAYTQIKNDSSLSLKPYPGQLLKINSNGEDVLYVQRLLNAIRSRYTQIPYLNEDGVYGSSTQEAVRIFQSLTGLSADGIVGQDTWTRLNSVYSNLSSNCMMLRDYPGYLLRLGSSGDNVNYIQQLLNAIRSVYTTIPVLDDDGVFGSRTESAVRTFQSLQGLSADGIVGRQTWTRLNEIYSSICSGTAPLGRSLQTEFDGSKTDRMPTDFTRPTADSYMEDYTTELVKNGSVAHSDTVINDKTWDFDVNKTDLQNQDTPNADAMPQSTEKGDFKTLKLGMADGCIPHLKHRLYELGYLNSAVGINTPMFGLSTRQALEKYQSQNGLEVTGTLDYETWCRIFD